MINVGWIGLGAMGGPMAVLVAQAGYQVRAFDLAAQRARSLEGQGITPAASALEAANGADVLALMVATPEQADAVLFGDDALAASLRPGTVVLLMATVGPAAVVSLAQRLEPAGVEVVDAPVSGGTARAATGDLLMMVSGTERALAVVRPLLDVMASRAAIVGSEPGDGQKVKLVNQLLCGVHIAAAAASFMLDDRGSRMVDDDGGEVRSALDIFVKDMGLVMEAARANTYAAPLAAAAEQLYLRGRRAGLGRRDDSSVIEVLRGNPPQ